MTTPFGTLATDDRFDLLIDGKLVVGDRQLEVVDPATGEVFARCSCASAEQLDRAVEAAAAAYPTWSRLTIERRQAKLIEMAEEFRLYAERLEKLH